MVIGGDSCSYLYLELKIEDEMRCCCLIFVLNDSEEEAILMDYIYVFELLTRGYVNHLMLVPAIPTAMKNKIPIIQHP